MGTRDHLFGGGGAGGSGFGRVCDLVGTKRGVPARPLERFEGHAVTELGDTNYGRVVLLDELPEAYGDI